MVFNNAYACYYNGVMYGAINNENKTSFDYLHRCVREHLLLLEARFFYYDMVLCNAVHKKQDLFDALDGIVKRKLNWAPELSVLILEYARWDVTSDYSVDHPFVKYTLKCDSWNHVPRWAWCRPSSSMVCVRYSVPTTVKQLVVFDVQNWVCKYGYILCLCG